MKKLLLNSVHIALGLFFSGNIFAQTVGTLTFSCTPVVHSPSYEATKSVMAIWIQTGTGGFVKSKLRRVGSVTSDHLPTWAVNSGGTANNCLAAACNVTDATTGATLTSFTSKTIIWDGKNVNGASNGVTVADGTYKVTIQETWNHGAASTTTRSYSFTKGPTAVHLTPANDADFTNIVIDWVPNTTGVEDIAAEPLISVYPNPSSGIFNIDLKTESTIKVVNTLGLVVYEVKADQPGTKSIDLSDLANGIYFVNVFNGQVSSNGKVILNK